MNILGEQTNELGHNCSRAFLIVFLIAFIGLFAQSDHAAVERRIALLIGNSDYTEGLARLDNPVHDAKLMANTLRTLSFDVIERTDADQKTMKRAIQDFGERLAQAGQDAVGLFYYAGHGLQVKGTNYLVPVKARIQREGDVEIEAVNVDWVLAQIEEVHNRINFVILDACRNNPLTRGFRSIVRGLAPLDAPKGTMIAYSTAPGSESVDGVGSRNSPYTEALAHTLKEPGLTAEEVFRKVRVQVLAVTREAQVPWEHSSLTGAFYFNPSSIADLKEISPGDQGPGTNDNRVELSYWDSINESRDPAAFQAYLDRYPTGNFADLARIKIRELTKDQAAADSDRSLAIVAMDTVLVANRRTMARTAPTPNAQQVDVIQAGREVQVTGQVRDGDWYRVRLDNEQTAFVWAPLLQEPARQKQAPTEKAPEDASAKPRISGAVITGLWQGRYRCQQEEVGFSLNVTMTTTRSDEVAAVFEFYPLPGDLSFPRGKSNMQGRYDRASSTISLEGRDWIKRPLGFERHDIEGQLDSSGAIIRGRILTTGCAEFVLTRK